MKLEIVTMKFKGEKDKLTYYGGRKVREREEIIKIGELGYRVNRRHVQAL